MSAHIITTRVSELEARVRVYREAIDGQQGGVVSVGKLHMTVGEAQGALWALQEQLDVWRNLQAEGYVP